MTHQFRSQLFGALLLLGAMAAGAGAWWLTSNRISGQDDGIYLSTALSLSSSGEYTQTFLPVARPQTKYPPLYPTLLSLFATGRTFDANHLAGYKILNACALAATLLFAVALLRGESVSWRVVAALLVATAPALVSFVDLLATEVLFSCLVMSALVFAGRGERRGSLECLALIAGLSALTRAVGLCLCLGVAWHALSRVGWRRAIPTLGIMSAIVLPWLAWRWVVFPADLVPLERYYLAYEQSAWQLLSTRPDEALGILITNLQVYPELMPMVAGWPTDWLAVIAAIMAVVGLGLLPSDQRDLLVKAGVPYVLILLGHPYPIDRYLVPLVPIAAVGIVTACAHVCRMRPTWGPVGAWMLAGTLILSQGLWVVKYAQLPSDQIHAAFGRPFHFSWPELDEAFNWIRRETLGTDVIASSLDSVVAAHTGRRTVRAWLHLPETWSPELQRRLTATETAAVVRRDFARLGVTHLLVSPPLRDVEGRFGEAVLRELTAAAPGMTEVSRSRNAQHIIYRVCEPRAARHRAATP